MFVNTMEDEDGDAAAVSSNSPPPLPPSPEPARRKAATTANMKMSKRDGTCMKRVSLKYEIMIISCHAPTPYDT